MFTNTAEVDAVEGHLLVEAGALLLDVREPMEYAQARAPEATLIPMGEIGHRVGELDREQTVVVICRSGNRSAAVTRFLAQQGFDARNLAGGMIAWSRAGLPVVSG